MPERLPRLVAATDDALLATSDFDTRLTRLLAAGLPTVLIRARAIDDRRFAAVVGRAREATTRYRAALWVGDRPDVARAHGADAVQLPEDGLSIAGARVVAGPRVRIGRSVHGVGAALAAARAGADHIVAGTIYRSRTHPGIEPSGPARIRRIRDALDADAPAPPIFAIGGVTADRVGDVLAAGAWGIVAIRALWEPPDSERAVTALLDAIGRASTPTLH